MRPRDADAGRSDLDGPPSCFDLDTKRPGKEPHAHSHGIGLASERASSTGARGSPGACWRRLTCALRAGGSAHACGGRSAGACSAGASASPRPRPSPPRAQAGRAAEGRCCPPHRRRPLAPRDLPHGRHPASPGGPAARCPCHRRPCARAPCRYHRARASVVAPPPLPRAGPAPPARTRRGRTGACRRACAATRRQTPWAS
eukprot:scaffold24579_cov60-Phaeocystis_antarctica.AAC.1